jgi:hypothetical protein
VKRTLSLVVGIVLIGVVAYLVWEYRADFGLGRPSGGSNPGNGSAAWQTVDRSADGFTIQMPAAVTESQIPAYNADGGAEQVPMIEATVDAPNGGAPNGGPGTTFAVAWADNPPVERAAGEDAEKTLDLARNGALARTQTSLVSESHREIDGHESREFVGRNAAGGILNGRLILAGTHLYMLIATFPQTEEQREEDVNRFFESFKLTGAMQQ